MYGVIDCNNFYVSCERIFNPKLAKIPVVVLSNNDGCIISRSQEVKDLGFPMGAAIYQYKELAEKNNVHILSANFTLYADISSRVMRLISTFSPRMEIYSVDEAFVGLSEFDSQHIEDRATKLHKKILQAVGVPVSIGIAQTKTLAKIASVLAKKQSTAGGAYLLTDEKKKNEVLQSLQVGQVWGIGRRLSVFLQAHGIYTAFQLMHCDDTWVQKQMSISVLRTVWELRGIHCIDLAAEHDPKKTIISSRSFGHAVETFTDLREAVSTYAARAAEKLREEKETASYVTVYITTNYHNMNYKQYHNAQTLSFEQPTDTTPEIISQAVHILESIFREGYRYKKAVVGLSGLQLRTTLQPSLFTKKEQDEKAVKVMTVLDKINRVWGTGTMKYAAEGISREWKGRSEKRTPRYTTRWEELCNVR